MQVIEATNNPTAVATPAAPTLPDDVAAQIHKHQPHAPGAAVWNANRELATTLAAHYRPKTPKHASNVCSHLTGFLLWYSKWPARNQNTPWTTADFTDAVIGAYVATIPNKHSASAARSVLRRCLLPYTPNPPLKVPAKPIAGPYTPAELARFKRLASDQPRIGVSSNLCFLIGLPLGAGLSATDLRYLTPNSISQATLDDGTTYLTVTVSAGNRPRTVPIRKDCETLIRRGLTFHTQLGRGENDLLIGARGDRSNVGENAKRRASHTGTVKVNFSLARLRTTWLVAAMCAPISLADILHLAGLTSARTLTDLLRYCPDPNPATVNQILLRLDAPGAAS